jgi:lysophospholipase L1-like esterase
MHPLFRHGLLFWATLPLMLPQALRLKRRAPRAAAAKGERGGLAHPDANDPNSSAPTLRLLAIGDSPFEGVGIERIADTLPVRLATHLAQASCVPVEWQIHARNGATASSVRARLLPAVETAPFDLILVSVGVNDVTGLTAGARFRRDLQALLAALRGHSPEARIVLLGIPPMQAFPLLPQPLRSWLGGRSRRLESIGIEVAHTSDALHSPVTVTPLPELFADDGFHPSALGHARWADSVLQQLQTQGLERVA